MLDTQGRFIGFEPVWRDDVIEVCQGEIQKFLDRRNWDIKEVIKTWTDSRSTPEAWAWDAARYENACDRMVKASVTVLSNEKYTSNISRCCGIQGASCGTATYTPQCSGVGFCIDHSTAVLSILRTLGVPPTNVYSVFELAPSSAHAWVLFKCDQSEPERLKPVECNGNDGKWLSIDATAHTVKPLDQTSYSTICLMWNDQGIYAQTAGRIDPIRGYAFDPTIPHSGFDPSLCIYDKLCKDPFSIECVVP
jgi:transglutaminase-like putative cysteine protease